MSIGHFHLRGNRKRLFCTLLLIIFVALVALYVVDFNRMDTIRKIERRGLHTSEDRMLSSLNVTSFAQDTDGRMWIGSSAGLNVYDGEGYIQFFHEPKDTTALPDDYINALHRDRTGHIWVGTQNGLARYEGGYRFRRFTVPNDSRNITRIADAPNDADSGAVMVTGGRKTYVVKSSGIVEPAGTSRMSERNETPDCNIDSLVLQKPHELITAAFHDADSNLWVGLHNAGYRILSDNVQKFAQANDNILATSTQGKDITSLARVGHHILAGTTLRLYTYDTQGNRITYVMFRNLFSPVPDDWTATEAVDHQEINNIVAHGSHEAWILNDYQILSCRLSSASIDVVGRTSFHKTSRTKIGTGTAAGDYLYASCDDGSILKSRFGTDEVEHIPIRSPWYGSDTQITTLRNGDLMLFMRNMHVAILSAKDHRLAEVHIADDGKGFANIDPAFVREDSHGNIWLGTRRSGLYRLREKEGRVERMNCIDDVHIQGLIEDGNQRLWITTLKDVTCYNPATGAALRNSLVSARNDGNPRQYFDLALCLAPDSTVIFGSSDGCIFLPESAGVLDKASEPLHIVGMDIRTTAGEELTINDHIQDGAHYTLSHKEKALTLRFFHPNYNGGSSLLYQFMLEGYDQTWREPSSKNTAYFANLTPGNYTFRVRLISSPGLPPVDECRIHIRVKPAPWNSAAAWFAYFVLIGYIVYLLNSFYLRMKSNHLLLLQEKHEREREQRTNEMNMSFFANISHEFRNPITLIAGPLVSLKDNTSLPQSVHQTLNTICVSVNRMLKLIDQMLDFNQLETDALRLMVAEIDVASVLREQVELLSETAKLRGISVTLSISEGNYNGWADLDKLEKILGNLFTNALKHTPDGGNIVVTASVDERRMLSFDVFNSGAHIADNKLRNVFRRYYQIDNIKENHHYGWGTGIGLYYVKRLVGLHHGTIGVQNVTDGVTFSTKLPINKEEYAQAEKANGKEKVMQIPVEHSAEQHTIATASKQGTALKKTKILIVDDDVDVAQYIRSLFAADFDVENRYSAEAALHDMEHIRPDIIVSDVVMGEMSGWDFCRTLKDNLMFSHIPIVLVTAKSNIDEQIQGLQLGAIAYVTKPFDPAYLQAIVRAQLNNLKSMRKRLGENVSTESIADTLSEQDRKFMNELYDLMEKRLGEMELNVATISRDLLVSPSKLTYKLRELTGETPGNFFRRFKLNKAAQMLREKKYPVSEIATLTGFGTAAHFSVAFKKQFGVTPSEYTK